MNILLTSIGFIIIIVSTSLYLINKNNDDFFGLQANVTLSKHIRNIIFSIIIILLSQSFVIIPTGYTGVRTTFGIIDNTTVQGGFNWKIPIIQSIEKVNNKRQDIEITDKIWSETSARTAIFYEGITVTYQISTDKSAWIFANISTYENNLITSELVSSAIKISSKVLSDSDASDRSYIEPLCKENLQKSLDEKYDENTIIINKVVINNVDFENSYNEAIAKKQQIQIEKETQQIENEKAIAKAEADAQVKKTEAEGEANALLTKARAEAEANKLLQQSLTDNILKEKYIEKWDGKLPQYTTDSNSAFIFDTKNN